MRGLNTLRVQYVLVEGGRLLRDKVSISPLRVPGYEARRRASLQPSAAAVPIVHRVHMLAVVRAHLALADVVLALLAAGINTAIVVAVVAVLVAVVVAVAAVVVAVVVADTLVVELVLGKLFD